MFAAKELGLDLDMLSWRLRQLTLVLPDLGAPGLAATPVTMHAGAHAPEAGWRLNIFWS